MKLYRALVKFDKENKIENIIVVDDGFSWKAFFFNPLWFLFHRMWIEVAMFVAIFYSLGFFSKFGDYNIFRNMLDVFKPQKEIDSENAERNRVLKEIAEKVKHSSNP